MKTKAYCPIWNYQATGLNWNFSKKLWDDSFSAFDDYKKIPEGIKLNFISSISSVIEGSLKNYLISKVDSLIKRKEWIEKELITEQNEKQDTSLTQKKFKEELAKELTSINKTFSRILKEYKMVRKVDEIKFSLFGIYYKIEYKLYSNTKKASDEYFRKYIEIVKNETWNELISHFKLIKGERLKVYTKKVDKKLMEDIEKVFQFRNFIVHSNNIEIEHNTKDVNYNGKVKKLIRYIDDKGFAVPDEKNIHNRKINA